MIEELLTGPLLSICLMRGENSYLHFYSNRKFFYRMPVRHLWRHNKASNLSSSYQIIHGGWFSVWIRFESFAIPFVKCCIVDCEYNCISAIHSIRVFGISTGTLSAFTGSHPVHLEHKAVITFFTIEKFHSIIV